MSTIPNPVTPISAHMTQRGSLRLKDPASAITHFVAMLLSVLAAPFLLSKAAVRSDPRYLASSFLFILSMILLYGASTAYHAVIADSRTTLILKKLDHIMIYFLIAGSYTPVCLLVLPAAEGLPICYLVWGVAISGLILTIFWVNSPKWLNSIIYIAMGWICIFSIHSIYSCMSREAFLWLLTGGIIYTIGGIIYALKLPLFNSLHKEFGSHEIFHLFVMAGSFCHFIMVYKYLL